MPHPADKAKKAAVNLEKSLQMLSKEHFRLVADLPSYDALLSENAAVWKGLMGAYKEGLGSEIKKLSDTGSSQFTKRYIDMIHLLKRYISVTKKTQDSLEGLSLKTSYVVKGMEDLKGALEDALKILNVVSPLSQKKAAGDLLQWAVTWSKLKDDWSAAIKKELNDLKKAKDASVKVYSKLYGTYKSNHSSMGLDIVESLSKVPTPKIASESARAIANSETTNLLAKDNELLEKKIKAVLDEIYLKSDMPKKIQRLLGRHREREGHRA